jgi:hypothetical protein
VRAYERALEHVRPILALHALRREAEVKHDGAAELLLLLFRGWSLAGSRWSAVKERC